MRWRTWCSRSRSATTTATSSCAPTPPSSDVQIDALRGVSVMHFGIVKMPLLDGTFTFATGDPEPGRHPLRLAGARRDVRGDEPGEDDGHAAHGRARGPHLDRERRRLVGRDGAAVLNGDWRRERHRRDAARGPAGLRGAGHGRDRGGGPSCGGRRATCRPSSSASSTSSSWPTRRWPAGAAIWATRCGWSTPPRSSTRWCPVESERAAGAVVKKGMRSLLLWYVGWLTHQMSQSASAVSRALHIVDDRLQELERQVEGQRVPAAGVVEFPASGAAGRLVGRARGGGRGQGAGTDPACRLR